MAQARMEKIWRRLRRMFSSNSAFFQHLAVPSPDDMNNVATVTLAPGCGFVVNESFECPEKDHEGVASVDDLEGSARSGCPTCILHYTTIREAVPEIPWYPDLTVWRSNLIELEVWRRLEPPSSGQIIRLKLERDTDSQSSVQYLTFNGRRYQFEHGSPGPELNVVPGDTSSLKSMQTARGWIETCDKEHSCTQNASVIYMPSRVLDVQNSCVRLLETADTPITTGYACLSHCWGDGRRTLCTTSLNIQCFKSSIAWSSLPRTFQDAISIARRLGVSYLWIDSLCIVQDDDMDWQQESAVMADIYQNAYITLAAASSLDAGGGCYTPEALRHKAQIRKHLAIIDFPDGTTCKAYPGREFWHYPKFFPLLKRGWVYQERILSPRILYFAGEELIWECHKNLDCECGYNRQKGGMWRRPVIHGNDTQLDLWMEVLQPYIVTSLTYSEDIFPALSGIVKVYQTVFNDTYVAGLWMRCLPQALLWYFSTNKKALNINAHSWRAPSWSWASQQCTESFHSFPCTQNIGKVENVVCEPSGADPTGRLASAQLTLTTKALSACLSFDIIEGVPEYVVCLKNGYKVKRSSWDCGITLPPIFLETGYVGLSDPRLTAGIQSLDITVAQIGYYTNEYSTMDILDLGKLGAEMMRRRRVAVCMLLAQHVEHTDCWVRIGLALITDFDAHLIGQEAMAPGDRSISFLTSTEFKSNWKKKKFRRELKKRTSQARDVFKHFDEGPMQSFIVL